MCGIVGFIGEQDAKEILLKGLEKLEYRGYDSAGIAVQAENGVIVYKEKGRIAKLREVVEENVAASGESVTHAGLHTVFQANKMRIRIKVHQNALH